jgi:hypothetical protein
MTAVGFVSLAVCVVALLDGNTCMNAMTPPPPPPPPPPPSLSQVVLLEPSMRLNVLSSVSLAGAKEVQREAASSVAWLRSADTNRDKALEAFEV